MKLALSTHLLPDDQQPTPLTVTVERFNETANWLAGLDFERNLAIKFAPQKLCHTEPRWRFGLSTDTAIRCIAQVSEAFKRENSIRLVFRPHATVPFSTGKNIRFKGPDHLSIRILVERTVVPYILRGIRGSEAARPEIQSDLPRAEARGDKGSVLPTRRQPSERQTACCEGQRLQQAGLPWKTSRRFATGPGFASCIHHV